jgi:DnaJ C terminal domain
LTKLHLPHMLTVVMTAVQGALPGLRLAHSRSQPMHAERRPCTEQGLKHGAKIVLRGEAGCSDPTVQPGDVVFVLDQKEHRFFKRINQVPPRLTPDALTAYRHSSCGRLPPCI